MRYIINIQSVCFGYLNLREYTYMKKSTKKALRKAGQELLKACVEILIGVVVYLICKQL